MLSYQNGIIKTSVRMLAEFLFRSGDIDLGQGVGSDITLMQEGSRLHRKIQKQQGGSYRAEVPLKLQWDEKDYMLALEGRADGIDERDGVYYIDEIKCVTQDVNLIQEADPLHLAQAKCYAYIFALQKELKTINVQITYCNLNTEEIKYLETSYTEQELTEWFAQVKETYKKWADLYVKKRKARDESIRQIRFPFSYRKGQKAMAALCYRSVTEKNKTFLQAPTGIGKTISALYPAIKAMPEQRLEKVYYLTSKTITGLAAQDAVALLMDNRLELATVAITAREKICVKEEVRCSPEICERARGHYDRINEALYQLLRDECFIKRDTVLRYAMQYQVCPYALSFEAADWADLLICDYNYVFDPHVNKQSFLEGRVTRQAVYLIDEAHNLLDRAREMYSAAISLRELDRMRKLLHHTSRSLQRRLTSCRRVILDWQEDQGEEPIRLLESADSLYFPLLRFCTALQQYLQEHSYINETEEISDTFFHFRHFLQMLENAENGYRIYTEMQNGDFRVRLFCIDPSSQITRYLGEGNSALFFSATLLPISYYRNLLCEGKAKAYAIPSPFPSQNCLRVITSDVTSRYRDRGASQYRRIVRYIEMAVRIKKGNYMVFFPSYEMMDAVYQCCMAASLPSLARISVQDQNMSEAERERFLGCFQEEGEEALVAFCVMGSIYSEGIDLKGNRLIGVFVVGTGLPGLSRERDLMRDYFEEIDRKGYDYAYRYPGIQKVLQAAGRVIRTASDTGMTVLMDDRFLQRENLRLLSEEWDHYYEANEYNFESILKQFWKQIDGR